jgi:dTDP-4-dehydrorhamnose 3,5-epimerase-like enzyme
MPARAPTSVSDQPAIPGSSLMEFQTIRDHRGNLTVVESGKHVPFDVRRVYWLYDVPGGETRAGHAHRELEQVLVAASGSFDVVLDDGERRRVVTLNRSHYGLYVPRMVWRAIENFSSGAVCLVLASAHYDSDDYFYDYEEFRAASRHA